MPPCFSSCSSPTTRPAQLVGRGLEQLVLRERLEELDDLLVVVRARDQVFGGQDLLELVVQQRRLRRRLHVRLRREQADQPRLAGDHALGVHDAHADVVHARAPMHRGVRVRLREDEQVAALDAGPHHVVEARRGASTSANAERLHVAQDAEPAAGHGPDRRASLTVDVDELVLAISEQDEVQLREPFEEVDRLADLLRRVADGRGPSELDHVADALLHRLEVAHHEPHVVQDRRRRVAPGPRVRSSESARSTSKCITDSRWLASRPDITRSMRPSSSRIVPTTGCSSRRTPSPRASSSSCTESTRNGESSVFVSTTVPTVS